jgi:hypothetical protein
MVSSLMNERRTLEHLSFSSVITKASPPPSTRTLAVRFPGGSLIDGPLSSNRIVGVHCNHSPDGNFPKMGASYSSAKGGTKSQMAPLKPLRRSSSWPLING